MNFIKDFNMNYTVCLNDTDYTKEIDNHLITKKNDGTVTTELFLEGINYLKLNLMINDKNNYIHIRGNMIEIFKDDNKIIEIHVTSSHLDNIYQKKNSVIIILHGCDISGVLTFRKKEFLNKRLQSPEKFETTFETHHNLRYHYIEATDNNLKDNLIVVFSAFSAEYTYNFNYVDTLKEINTNKLFILDDFGAKGSYYLGREKNFSIENSIISLILYIASKNNINMKNIISVGSSKGGYSALYFGMKYSFGNIITLAPSLYLGSFLKKYHPEMLDYILGSNSEADKIYLDSLIYRIPTANQELNLKIMVGTKDSRKEKHIEPFIEYLEDIGYPYEYDLIEGVDHSQLQYFAPDYIKVQLSNILKIPKISEMYLTALNFTIENNTAKVNIETIGQNLEYAYYWYCDNIVLKKVLYSNEKQSEIPITESGSYRVRVFLRDSDKIIITKSSRTINVNHKGEL
ncbi:hypothetical protein [Gracilibacillus massiliensis]|uniref:hypothetical protein n=1 Tax=Gracilibacillus massiliensis TaxID=1564956 RepID=UPI00071D30A9|nr:hypothetical protein [Gracilibacillus massiliensis]